MFVINIVTGRHSSSLIHGLSLPDQVAGILDGWNVLKKWIGELWMWYPEQDEELPSLQELPTVDVGSAIGKNLSNVGNDPQKFIELADAHYCQYSGCLNQVWLGVFTTEEIDLEACDNMLSNLFQHLSDNYYDDPGRLYPSTVEYADRRKVYLTLYHVCETCRDGVEFAYSYLHCWTRIGRLDPRQYPVGKDYPSPLEVGDFLAETDPSPNAFWTRPRTDLTHIFEQLVTKEHPTKGGPVVNATADLRAAWVDYWCGVADAPQTSLTVFGRGNRRRLGWVLYNLRLDREGVTDVRQASVFTQTFSCWRNAESVRTGYLQGENISKPPSGYYLELAADGVGLFWTNGGKD